MGTIFLRQTTKAVEIIDVQWHILPRKEPANNVSSHAYHMMSNIEGSIIHVIIDISLK